MMGRAASLRTQAGITMNTVFIHGRPGPHPFHQALADSVGAEARFVDPILRWHDQDCSAVRRYMSSLLCSLVFPNRGKFDIFLTEGAHLPPVGMRKMGLLRPWQRTVALMDNESLYFLKSGFYPESVRRKVLWLVRSFDALVCIGRMQCRIADELLRPYATRPKIYEGFSAIKSSRAAALGAVTPETSGKTIVFIGRGPGGFRTWYKGLDLLFESFERALAVKPDLLLEVVGEWDEAEARRLLERHPAAAGRTTFAGDLPDICPSLERAALYVHLARGEAFGISVLEAMMAGVPAIVSEWTGASEAVERAGTEWVVPLDPEQAAARIVCYFGMSGAERSRLSGLSRTAAGAYTEERAFARFRHLMGEIAAGTGRPGAGSLSIRGSARRN
jgi:glycosyltransferase involved in cell wall biosynthesis